MAKAPSLSCTSTISVISNSSRAAGSPDAASALTTVGTKFRLLNWAGERFTAMVTCVGQRTEVRWPTHVTIAVNLSPAQFKSRNLVPTVVNALAASGLPAARLELEITEMVLVQDNDGAFAILHQLRNLGIRIVMDRS